MVLEQLSMSGTKNIIEAFSNLQNLGEQLAARLQFCIACKQAAGQTRSQDHAFSNLQVHIWVCSTHTPSRFFLDGELLKRPVSPWSPI